MAVIKAVLMTVAAAVVVSVAVVMIMEGAGMSKLRTVALCLESLTSLVDLNPPLPSSQSLGAHL